MRNKLWLYLTAGLSFLASILTALVYREKAKSAQTQAELAELIKEQEQEARELVENASQVMVEGLHNEQNQEPIDSSRRDYFSS